MASSWLSKILPRFTEIIIAGSCLIFPSENIFQHKEDESVEAFTAKIGDLEKRIVELDSENQKLRQTHDEASKTLKVYVDREKDATIKAIVEKADWNQDELDKIDLPQLKLISRRLTTLRTW